MSALATCAGFRDDVLPAVIACGPSVELGDHVPFTELFPGQDRGLLLVVIAASVRVGDGLPLAVDEMIGAEVPGVGESLRVLTVTRAAVEAVARIGDTGMARVWEGAWEQLGRVLPVPADLTQSIRGFVVQCRAAVANGWEVFVIERREALPA
ncbi:MAG: hypothetical protein RL562_3486 [Planctomycetota bacterium]